MVQQILINIKGFFELTAQTEVLWSFIPLAIATIVMVSYFEKYRDENPDWSTYLTTCMVLLFVSIALLRHIYNLTPQGILNIVEFPQESIAAITLLVIGCAILIFNFEHFFPKKIANNISSPLTVNSIAYCTILFVHSEKIKDINFYISLIVFLVLILSVVNGIKIPISKFFRRMGEMKKKEKIEEVKSIRSKITEHKKNLSFLEKNVKKAKIKELENQKNEAVKLKKELRD